MASLPSFGSFSIALLVALQLASTLSRRATAAGSVAASSRGDNRRRCPRATVPRIDFAWYCAQASAASIASCCTLISACLAPCSDKRQPGGEERDQQRRPLRRVRAWLGRALVRRMPRLRDGHAVRHVLGVLVVLEGLVHAVIGCLFAVAGRPGLGGRIAML